MEVSNALSHNMLLTYDSKIDSYGQKQNKAL